MEVGLKLAKRARFEFLDNLQLVTHAEPEQYGKQIDDYYNAPLLEEPADPQQYWKENQFIYPALAKLACCISIFQHHQPLLREYSQLLVVSSDQTGTGFQTNDSRNSCL